MITAINYFAASLWIINAIIWWRVSLLALIGCAVLVIACLLISKHTDVYIWRGR